MKTMTIAVVLAALPLVAVAQDPVTVDAAHYKVVVDNPSVRVLRIHVAAGAKNVRPVAAALGEREQFAHEVDACHAFG